MAYLDSLYKTNFVEYASYVIKDRAIPHLDDGLKPVQRRILHTLFELDDGKFHKVANAVGQCMRFHPHGDASIYSALVVLANKDLFIERQGNFGNIYTGDTASAARYIECRLSPLAREVMFDPNITEYVDSYDGRNREPVVLPAKVPALLALGAEGIAVGMSTRIMPHNLIELMEAQVAYMRDEPIHVVPDFPTGGLIDVSGYDDGNGKVLVRAKLDTSDPKRILIHEIPYSTTTESLISSIEEAARKNRVKVTAIQDFTASEVEIELKLARGVYAEEVVDSLYAFTDCEVSISCNLLVIDDDRPRVMTVTEVLQHNLDRLVDILKAELSFERQELENKLHAKTLEQIFIENRIYKQIEEQKTAAAVTAAVSDGLQPFSKKIGREVTAEDVDTLLRIPIRRISLYDIERARKETREIKSRLVQIAHDVENIVEFSISYLEILIEKYRDQYPRRSEITGIERVEARDAAKRDMKLTYDRMSGYLGYQVDGPGLFDVSLFDRILAIRKDGSYSVIDAPDKLFVGKGMLHCSFPDKGLVFSAIYKDDAGYGYIKRCRIDKFILNRTYELVPAGTTLLKLTTAESGTVNMEYKPKPRVRILAEEFEIADYPIRGLKAGGIRLAARELKSCTVT